MAKIQYNVSNKEAKATKDILAKFWIAMTDEKIIDKDMTRAQYDATIATETERLDKIVKGEVKLIGNNTVESETEHLNALKLEYAEKLAEIDVHISENAKAMRSTYDLISDDLVKSVIASITDVYDHSKYVALCESIAKWFVENGFKDATAENVEPFALASYGAMRLPSVRSAVKKQKWDVSASKQTVCKYVLFSICKDPSFSAFLPVNKFAHAYEKKAKSFVSVQ